MNVIKVVLLLALAFLLSGCIVGDVVALPFRVTGSVLNTVTPDVLGDSVYGVGDAIDKVIPF